MTFATKITVTRILLVPVFVLFAVYYGESALNGDPQEWLRMATVVVFLIASASDGIDGWVARRFNQKSALGAVLDPIADKGLLLAAIITLSVSGWPRAFPLWFAVLVIARDAIIVTGCIVLKHMDGHLEVRPSMVGKAATAFQMVAIAWVMLQFPGHMIPVIVAGTLTLLSGAEYVARGIRQLHANQPGGEVIRKDSTNH
jgi:cardiolipin synthase (CMP-forming)